MTKLELDDLLDLENSLSDDTIIDENSTIQLLEHAWSIRETECTEAKRIAMNVLTAAQAQHSSRDRTLVYEACAAVILGYVHRRQEDLSQSILDTLNALDILNRLSEKTRPFENKWFGRGKANLGTLYFHIAEWDQAIEHLLQAIEVAHETADEELITLANHNLGLVYLDIEQYQLATEFFMKALPYLEVQPNLTLYTYALTNLSHAWIKLGLHQQARNALNGCLMLVQDAGERHAESVVLRLLGILEESLAETKQALTHYKDALRLNENHGNSYTGILINLAIGKLYLDSSMSEASIGYLNNALELSKEIGEQTLQYQSHEVLSQAYSAQDNSRLALYHYKEFHHIKESVFTYNNEQRIKTFRTLYGGHKDHRSNRNLNAATESGSEFTELDLRQVKRLQSSSTRGHTNSRIKSLAPQVGNQRSHLAYREASSTVHDIRSRMMVLNVYNDMLQSSTASLSTEKRHGAHQNIKKSIVELNRLISKLEAEIRHFREVDINAVH